MALNKGEWSELYAIFYLISNRKLKLVDSSLREITSDIFEVRDIITKKKKGEVRFHIQDECVIPTVFGIQQDPISIESIESFRTELFTNIIDGGTKKGAFELSNTVIWLKQHEIYSSYKANSNNKEDIFTLNFDSRVKKEIKLGYSIKSQLGRSATILNASSHTNFRYVIRNFKSEYISQVNSIQTESKLLDRIKQIESLGGIIEFVDVESPIFKRNLEMIDMLLPQALGEILFKSYQQNNKDLKQLFSQSDVYKTDILAKKKLKDFLLSISLGMVPSQSWNGEYTADGGIMIVASDSHVYVLDMIYFANEVRNFLISQTKLDSPSSSRHHMLELYEDESENEIFFTLNLQIRYK